MGACRYKPLNEPPIHKSLIDLLQEELDATYHQAAEPQRGDGGYTYVDGIAKAIRIVRQHEAEQPPIDRAVYKHVCQKIEEAMIGEYYPVSWATTSKIAKASIAAIGSFCARTQNDNTEEKQLSGDRSIMGLISDVIHKELPFGTMSTGWINEISSKIAEALNAQASNTLVPNVQKEPENGRIISKIQFPMGESTIEHSPSNEVCRGQDSPKVDSPMKSGGYSEEKYSIDLTRRGYHPKSIPYQNEDTATGKVNFIGCGHIQEIEQQREIRVVDDSSLIKIAAELWVYAQVQTQAGEGIEDAENRIVEFLRPYLRTTEPVITGEVPVIRNVIRAAVMVGREVSPAVGECVNCVSYSTEIHEIVRVARDNPKSLIEFLKMNFPKEWGLSKEEHKALLDAPLEPVKISGMDELERSARLRVLTDYLPDFPNDPPWVWSSEEIAMLRAACAKRFDETLRTESLFCIAATGIRIYLARKHRGEFSNVD